MEKLKIKEMISNMNYIINQPSAPHSLVSNLAWLLLSFWFWYHNRLIQWSSIAILIMSVVFIRFILFLTIVTDYLRLYLLIWFITAYTDIIAILILWAISLKEWIRSKRILYCWTLYHIFSYWVFSCLRKLKFHWLLA